MLIWVEDKDETLISLEGMRDLNLMLSGHDDETTCWSVVSVYTDDSIRILAEYDNKEAAKTYRRYLGMSIGRAARDKEGFLIVPYLPQENADAMTAEFARWDAADKAKRAVAKAAARTKQEDKGEYTPSI